MESQRDVTELKRKEREQQGDDEDGERDTKGQGKLQDGSITVLMIFKVNRSVIITFNFNYFPVSTPILTI